MKIILCTTPIRPVPTIYPPYGSMAVIQSLRGAGYQPLFFDIDGRRPSMEEVERYFREQQPDVVGISAVVSTAYAYTKRLARMIRRVCPQARIVLGGNMAASAELLHRLAGIDICVIGEGELIAVNLMRALESMVGKPLDHSLLESVRGISFLRPNGDMAFTGYEVRLPADEVFKPDFSILDRDSRIENYIVDPLTRPEFIKDPRSSQPHRRGKKVVTLITAKGCVARCTFCHRWDKGYRAIPVSQIVSHVKSLMERYNVGFFMFGDENFGSDRRQVDEFLARIKELDVLWTVGGVRVRAVDLDLLKRMKEAGCVSVFYGMETGSPDILEVMEKKASLQDNLNAAKWTREAGLFTIYQMILGMPGETEKTIKETTSFLKTVTQEAYESPRSLMSLNYIQALPGTPVYEYARHKGLIGKTLLEEEKYLLSISDIDAADDTKMPNYTDYDYLTVRSWRRRIVMDVLRHYHLHNKTPFPGFAALFSGLLRRLFKKSADHYSADAAEARKMVIEEYNKGGYFNLQRDLGYDVIVAYFYPLRHVILAVWLLQDEFRRLPLKEFLGHILEWLRVRLSPPENAAAPAVSMRQRMAELSAPPASPSEAAMAPMREGR